MLIFIVCLWIVLVCLSSLIVVYYISEYMVLSIDAVFVITFWILSINSVIAIFYLTSLIRPSITSNKGKNLHTTKEETNAL